MAIVDNDLTQYAEIKKITVEEYLTLLDLKMKEQKQKLKQQQQVYDGR